MDCPLPAALPGLRVCPIVAWSEKKPFCLNSEGAETSTQRRPNQSTILTYPDLTCLAAAQRSGAPLFSTSESLSPPYAPCFCGQARTTPAPSGRSAAKAVAEGGPGPCRKECPVESLLLAQGHCVVQGSLRCFARTRVNWQFVAGERAPGSLAALPAALQVDYVGLRIVEHRCCWHYARYALPPYLSLLCPELPNRTPHTAPPPSPHWRPESCLCCRVI